VKIKILPQAEQDLIDGFHFYEMQQTGLGGYFLDTLFSDIESLEFFAGVHPVVYGQHRLLSKRFPFAVYYKMANGTAQVYAVLDCRRNPAWIHERLK
jgi:hypothetical protein